MQTTNKQTQNVDAFCVYRCDKYQKGEKDNSRELIFKTYDEMANWFLSQFYYSNNWSIAGFGYLSERIDYKYEQGRQVYSPEKHVYCFRSVRTGLLLDVEQIRNRAANLRQQRYYSNKLVLRSNDQKGEPVSGVGKGRRSWNHGAGPRYVGILRAAACIKQEVKDFIEETGIPARIAQLKFKQARANKNYSGCWCWTVFPGDCSKSWKDQSKKKKQWE